MVIHAVNGLWKIRRQRGRGVGGSIAARGGRGEHLCVSVSLQALRGFDFEGDQYVALPDWRAEKTRGWLIDRSGSSTRKLNTVDFCNLPVECGTDGKWWIKATGSSACGGTSKLFCFAVPLFPGIVIDGAWWADLLWRTPQRWARGTVQTGVGLKLWEL